TIVMLQFDVMLMIYGLLQGLACEIVFAIVKYKSTALMVAVLAGVAAALSTLPLDWYYGYLGHLETWNLVLMVGFRVLSGALIAGWLAHTLYRGLGETGVLKLVGSRSPDRSDGLSKMTIDIGNLRVRFDGEGENLFNGMDIRVEKGETVPLLGPRGSGKTTLLNIMGALISRVIDSPMKADTLKF